MDDQVPASLLQIPFKDMKNSGHVSDTLPTTAQSVFGIYTAPTLFRLPRELRDMIYERYMPDTDGLVYDPKTRGFRTTNGKPICTSLGHTCHIIYDEFFERSFQLNSSIFHTAVFEKTSKRAGLWHGGIRKLDLYKDLLVERMAHRFMTKAIEKEIGLLYPQFKSILAKWRLRGHVTCNSDGHGWGETPSVYRDFVYNTIKIIAKNPKFDRVGTKWVRGSLEISHDEHRAYNSIVEFIDLHPVPWNIPSNRELSHLGLISGMDGRVRGAHDDEPTFYDDTANYRYSAASVAIEFLKNTPAMMRKHIRNIKLIEDHESTAYPECHMRGFIPFCLEMPKLRIERSVNLWMTAYPFNDTPKIRIKRHFNLWVTAFRSKDGYPWDAEAWKSMPPFIRASLLANRRRREDQMCLQCETKAIARWMTEANALESLGMPTGAFTLLFDGDPYPELAQHIFSTIFQRGIAWQVALDMSYASEDSGLPQPSWLDRRRRTGYVYEDTPMLVRNMNLGTGIIRCNFDIGREHNARDIALECRDMGIEGWIEQWYDYQEYWQKETLWPFHPLPDFFALRREYLIPI